MSHAPTDPPLRRMPLLPEYLHPLDAVHLSMHFAAELLPTHVALQTLCWQSEDLCLRQQKAFRRVVLAPERHKVSTFILTSQSHHFAHIT
jgi:hypothetical protein